MHQNISLTTTIQQVDVYRDQALISRIATVKNCSEGLFSYVIEGLSQHIDLSSVRIHCSTAFVQVLNVTVTPKFSLYDGSQLSESDQKIELLQQQLVSMQTKKNQLDQQINWFENLQSRSFKPESLPEKLAFSKCDIVAGQLQWADTITKQLLPLKQQQRELQRQIEAQEEKNYHAKDQRNKQGVAQKTALANWHQCIYFQLQTKNELASIELAISYIMPGVFWAPAYEIRLLERQQKIELVLIALVAQQCGEDWENVVMTFSSANLQRSTTLPELESWRIGRDMPQPPSGWRNAPDGLATLFYDYLQEIPKKSSYRPVLQQPTLDPIPIIEKILFKNNIKKQRKEQQSKQDGLFHQTEPLLMEEEATEVFCEDNLDIDIGSVDLDAQAGAVLAASMATEDDAAMSAEADQVSAMSLDTMEQPLPSDGVARLRKSSSNPKKNKIFGKTSASLERGITQQTTIVQMKTKKEILIYQNLRLQSAQSGSQRGQLTFATQAANKQRTPKISRHQLKLPKATLSNLPTTAHYTVRYPLEGNAQILSNATLHQLTLMRRKAEVCHIYRCIPCIDSQVYHFAEFQNPFGLPLLAGSVEVYDEADFMVTAPLENTAIQQTISTNLGVENNIIIARNVDFREITEGLFKGDSALIHRIEIEVRSKIRYPVKLEIIERVPYSKEEEIKVKILRTEPKAEEYTQVERKHCIKGGWKFTLELPAQASRTCILEYQISLPNKKTLEGGNRRV